MIQVEEALERILARVGVLGDEQVPLARALVDAGLPVLEVTLRTDCALEAIARLAFADVAQHEHA